MEGSHHHYTWILASINHQLSSPVSGPTIALSRAAERATIKRGGQINEYMCVNRRWRRRLQRHVGPGYGERRAFGSPDRGHGRDTGVIERGRDVIGRWIVPHAIRRKTIPHATIIHSQRRARRRTIRHATPIPHVVPSDGRYGTRRARRDGVPGDRRYGTRRSSRVRRCPEMPGYARLCPVMPGRCSVIPGDVSLPGLSGDCFTGCERPNASP